MHKAYERVTELIQLIACEDWKLDLGTGAMSLDFTVAPQELAVIELPLP